MPTIQINALDPLFFRDAKPFEMGDENIGNIQFPPNPTVMRGMLRSIGVFHNNEFDSAAANSENIEIQSIELVNNNNPIFPIPLDLLAYKGETMTYGLKLAEEKYLNSSPLSLDLLPPKLAKKTQDFTNTFLSQIAFEEYLQTGKNDFTIDKDLIDISNMITQEPKFGIGRSKETHTVSEGKLFKLPMMRLSNSKDEHLKFRISYSSSMAIPNSGFAKLGGEGKVIHFAEKEITPIPKPNFVSNQFKIYLATPAIFENGSLPNMEELSKRVGVKIKIIACAIGKPMFIGGFDMAIKKPKPMYRAVPAGSIYYCEIDDENDMSKVIAALHGQSISEKLKKDGFGKVYVCNLKK